MLDAICAERRWPVISKEIQPDHIHLFVSIPPAIAVADAVKVLKGVTASRLFQQFPALKKRLGVSVQRQRWVQAWPGQHR